MPFNARKFFLFTGLFGAGVGFLDLLTGGAITGKAKAAGGGGPVNETDVDSLARLLMAETGGRHSYDEETSIMQVAINRAKRHQTSIYNVVRSIRPAPLWNSSEQYRRALENGHRAANFEKAKERARDILSGAAPNLIGPRRHFVHPATILARGGRLPAWIVSRSQGGRAEYEPIDVGEARFA